MLAFDAEESRCLLDLPDELLLDAHMAAQEREGARPDSRGARRLAGSQDSPTALSQGYVRETFVLVRSFAQRTGFNVLQELRASNALGR